MLSLLAGTLSVHLLDLQFLSDGHLQFGLQFMGLELALTGGVAHVLGKLAVGGGEFSQFSVPVVPLVQKFEVSLIEGVDGGQGIG